MCLGAYTRGQMIIRILFYSALLCYIHMFSRRIEDSSEGNIFASFQRVFRIYIWKYGINFHIHIDRFMTPDAYDEPRGTRHYILLKCSVQSGRAVGLPWPTALVVGVAPPEFCENWACYCGSAVIECLSGAMLLEFVVRDI